MNQSFNQPQRQSVAGILIFFGYQTQKFIKSFWFFFLYLLFKAKDHQLEVILGLMALLLVGGIISFLNYWYFTFWINEKSGEFVLHQGIINKKTTTVPLEKIQNVNFTQNILHKIANVHKVIIDTAGSSGQEVAINALPLKLADALKEVLIQNSHVQVVEEDIEPSNQVERLFQISNWTLLKMGLTSKYRESIVLFIAAFLYLMSHVEDLVQYEFLNQQEVDQWFNQMNLLMIVVILIPFIIIFLLVVNVVRTFFKYYNYSVIYKNDNLVFKYGLLKTREIILKPYKIQKLTTSQNWFQKKMKLFEVNVHQINDDVTTVKAKDKLQLPGCNNDELQKIFNYIYNENPIYEETLLPNIRRLIIHFFLFLIMPMLVFSVLKYSDIIYVSWIYTVIYIFFVSIFVLIDFKNYKLFTNADFVNKQHGVWDISQSTAEIYKVQAIELKQYFWQKQTNIGSVTLFMSGSNLNFNTTNFSKLIQNTNLWLYKVETNMKRWI